MYSHVLTSVLKIHSCRVIAGTVLLLLAAISNNVLLQSSGLDSMSSIAISYGENGPVFCGLKSDGSHLVSCYGSNSAIIYGTPAHFPFQGISAGDGFVCGLLVKSNQPYCWGNNNYIQMGVPQPMTKGAQYSEISAGDNHLCGLRTETTLEKNTSSNSFVDCWGYNMTSNMVFEGEIMSISAGSEFNCALFSHNRSVLCWGDETSSRVISLIPKNTRFKTIAAGGYHVCGIQEGVDSRVLCWGRSLDMEEELVSVRRKGNNIDQAPAYPMLSVVGGKFHACGIRSFDRGIVCWGFQVAKSSTPPPNAMKMYVIAAGDYFTCGVVDKSLSPVCWGSGFPSSIPMAVSPGLCKSKPCNPGFYEFNSPSGVACSSSSSRRPDSRICLPCSNPCDMHPRGACSTDSSVDHDGREHCVLNCTGCTSSECFFSNCSSGDPSISVEPEKKARRFWAIQLPAIVAEACFAVFWVCVVCLTAGLYVRHKLRHCSCSTLTKQPIINQKSENYKEMKLLEDHQQQLKKMSRAQQFTYEELQRATGGFKEESIVGKGSFSCVFKGVLKDGTAVAVKRAILSSDMKKNSKEFHTELDLLSRLNHAHLLNLLGYCEEGGERLLVYEFMAHGSLHQHLHGNKNKEQLDWVRRVTIAVQAARGIEYLHGYACPPVIHRDIKSSNILIDEEHNARVSDFGLSLLGPTDSSSPLAELPAGTLGYLDPEYYRLHYLTTKSDVYSFGVLLLEILSGRKAIDMQFEEGNIVQWAVPLIKSGDISAILDPVLKPPADLEALIRIANVACKCVRMRGKDRPSMEKVTTALERALALLMGTPCSEQPILPTEVVLGSSRMHKKSSQRSSNRSSEDVTTSADHDFQRFEFRAPSWITFPSVASSQRRKSSVSDADLEVRNCAAAAAAGGDTRNPASTERNNGSSNNNCTEGLRSLEEEIGPASPQQNLFLKHNF